MKNFYREKMKFRVYISLTILLTAILVIGCADINEESAITVNQSYGVHGPGSMDKDSPNFHGTYLNDKSFHDCMQCHGGDFNGGTTSVSCNSNSCHPTINVHKEGITDQESEDFHGFYIKDISWDIRQCGSCHGDTYNGGISSPTCNTCHSNDNGPEQCNTCHGDFTNPSFIAPPQDLSDLMETTSPGVGSHYTHVYDNTLSENPTSCFECHINRSSEGEKFVYSHITGNGAEIEFGTFSSSGVSSPIYTQTNCENTYCHGNFQFKKSESDNGWGYADSVIVGNNFSPKWNQVDSTQAVCGTCHGQEIDGSLSPLPVGHIGSYQRENCVNCHSAVVDANGNIIDKLKHINGESNLSD